MMRQTLLWRNQRRGSEMKRRVEEIASDARTLEEKLNTLGDRCAMETIVWANGKLFVVVREYSGRRHRRKRGGNWKNKLPNSGEQLRKDAQ